MDNDTIVTYNTLNTYSIWIRTTIVFFACSLWGEKKVAIRFKTVTSFSENVGKFEKLQTQLVALSRYLTCTCICMCA